MSDQGDAMDVAQEVPEDVPETAELKRKEGEGAAEDEAGEEVGDEPATKKAKPDEDDSTAAGAAEEAGGAGSVGGSVGWVGNGGGGSRSHGGDARDDVCAFAAKLRPGTLKHTCFVLLQRVGAAGMETNAMLETAVKEDLYTVGSCAQVEYTVNPTRSLKPPPGDPTLEAYEV
jgi:hypothetical protein